MNILDLQEKDRKKAAAVLARAFFDYPSFTCYFPEVQRRERVLPRFMDMVLRCAMQFGSVDTTADIDGVLFTLSQEHGNLSDWEYIRNGFLPIPYMMGLKNFQRMIECEEFVKQLHDELMKDKPHEYIWGLAVDPEKQAKGVGSALLKNVLEKAGKQGKSVYLETHLERNVPYYENFGFHVLRSAAIPGHDISLWCMACNPDGEQIHS